MNTSVHTVPTLPPKGLATLYNLWANSDTEEHEDFPAYAANATGLACAYAGARLGVVKRA